MNNIAIPGSVLRFIYGVALRAKKLLPKKKCIAFDQTDKESIHGFIEHIYVINLDRQPQRWKQVLGEFSQVLDAKGRALSGYVRRISAVDALDFESVVEPETVDRTYTLGEQLYVDPRRVLPSKLNLDEEVQMSRQEIAVALSHIEIWKKIAAGKDQYALVIEDDICLSHRFSNYVGKVWSELLQLRGESVLFDILYLSYREVDQGAEKTPVTENTFQLFRGVWFLSGYVLSKRGAERLLSQLPVRGPVDLWVNHKFSTIDALLASSSVIEQRIDEKSQNSYSILPVLSKIGVLNSETPGTYKSIPLVKPIFVVGKDNEELTSLAMALSMLGYRCCSDLDKLPDGGRGLLAEEDGASNFEAFVNIGCIDVNIDKLAPIHPSGRLVVVGQSLSKDEIDSLVESWSDRSLVLTSHAVYKWKAICEFLGLVPPASPYPKLRGLGQRKIDHKNNGLENRTQSSHVWLQTDSSPWVLPDKKNLDGLSLISNSLNDSEWTCVASDSFNSFNDDFWLKRDDTFPGNMALFRPSNLSISNGSPAEITVSHEDLGVRKFGAAALTSRRDFLFGRFEAVLKPPKIDGIITGLFLHRDSPRQEIDIEFLGKDPRKMLINVYYNPGCEGARFDYGYRGTPVVIDLGFDATTDFHSYAIEWDENELRWHVDGVIVHKRSNWEPTPIPHLPMKFHLNCWPSASRELAGKMDVKLLPAKSLIKSVLISTSEHDHLGITKNMRESEELLEWEKV
jgi:GR25 family glycosyltransferase involved in LPS biosynthesis